MPRSLPLVLVLVVFALAVILTIAKREPSGPVRDSARVPGNSLSDHGRVDHDVEPPTHPMSEESTVILAGRPEWNSLLSSHPQDQPAVLTRILGWAISHREDFDRETRRILESTESDRLILSYVIILRGLALGPKSNLEFIDRVQHDETLSRAFILSLGAVQQSEVPSDDSHVRLCRAIVYGPVLCTEPRLRYVRIAALSRRFDDTLLHLGFGKIQQDEALDAALRLLRNVDPYFIEVCASVLLPVSNPEVVRFGISVLHDDRCPDTCKASVVEVLAAGDETAQRALLVSAGDQSLTSDTRSTIVASLASRADGDYVGFVERFRQDPSPEVRRAVVHCLSCSPDAHLEKALDAAALILQAERDPAVRRLMVADLASNTRRIEKRASVLADVALQDRNAHCRLAALDGLVALGSAARIEIAGKLSVSDPDETVRRRASEVFRARK